MNVFPAARLPFLLATAATFALALLPGCGSSGPRRFRVSGTVTQDGKPVPGGRVVLEPDASRGNSGPQGFAIIENGAFDTARQGAGAVAGAVLVRVDPFDGVFRSDAELRTMPAAPEPFVQPVEITQPHTTLNLQLPSAPVHP